MNATKSQVLTNLLIINISKRELIELSLKKAGIDTYSIAPCSKTTEYVEFGSFIDIQPLINELLSQGLNPKGLILY